MSPEAQTYHRALALAPEQLERACTERIYRMAWRYAKSAHVTERLRMGSSLTAKFHGTRGIYTARLDVEDRQFQFQCTCPLSGSHEPCKHVIALGLAWLNEPDTFHDLDLTLSRLAAAKKSELITLIRLVAQRLPDVIPLLDKAFGAP